MVHTISDEDVVAEIPEDLALDTDRQVYVGPESDLEHVEGVAAVGQSLVINAGNVLRPLVGNPISGKQLERIQNELLDVLQNDVQIEGVRRVDVTEINTDTNTVIVEVFTGIDNSFTLPVEI